MSKVWVDRGLLGQCVELLDLLPESRTIVGVRAILAQPAAAEGVDGNSHGPTRSFADVLREADVLLKLGRANKRIDELQAENERLTQQLMSVMTRHFAERLKDRADSQRLDECLSEGIGMLEAERDQLRAEVEGLRKAPAGWAKMDPAFVVEHIRETTVFDADMIEAMLEFAIGAAMAAKEGV